MISLETVYNLSEYAIKQKRSNSVSMFPPNWALDLIRDSVGNLSLTDEQIYQWMQDILQDLQIRHASFESPYKQIMEQVLDEVNFQLKTSMVHVYTMVPVQGLELSMPYFRGIKITDEVNVRKIADWEWNRYFHTLEVWNNNFPSIAFEWTRNAHIDTLENLYNDNSHFDNVMRNAHLISTVLQLQVPQGMAFPWMIQYVPLCQYTGNVGKISTTSFPDKASDNATLQVYSEENLQSGYNLEHSIRICKADLRIRLEVAFRRFHDAINKMDYTDRIVDQWIAVESLFGDGEGNQARQMACRLVCLLFDNLDLEDRQNAFIWVMNQWYKTRCKIVHGTYREYSFDDYSIAVMTQEVVKRLIVKMVKSSLSYHEMLLRIDKMSNKTSLPNKLKLDELGSNNEQIMVMSSILERYDMKTE